MRTQSIIIALGFVLSFVSGCAGSSASAPSAHVVRVPALESPAPIPPSASVAQPDVGEPYEIVGYLHRDREGALAVDSAVDTDGIPSVWVGGERAGELAALIDGVTEFPTISGPEGIENRRHEDTTLVSAVGNRGDRSRRTHLSPVVVGVRGVMRGGKLDVTDVTGVATSRAWNEAKPAYFESLKQARRAFDANDAAKARRALDEARDGLKKTFGEIAPAFEVYRFIDGLASRFDKASDAVARTQDPLPYADAVLPLHRARPIEGRMAAFPEETDVVFAAFGFAKRKIYRALKAELGRADDIARGRALLKMSGVEPKRDVAMMQWIYAHVPEAAHMY